MGIVPFSMDLPPKIICWAHTERLAARIHMDQKRTNGTFLSAGAHRFLAGAKGPGIPRKSLKRPFPGFPGVLGQKRPFSRFLGVRTDFLGVQGQESGNRGSGSGKLGSGRPGNGDPGSKKSRTGTPLPGTVRSENPGARDRKKSRSDPQKKVIPQKKETGTHYEPPPCLQQ